MGTEVLPRKQRAERKKCWKMWDNGPTPVSKIPDKSNNQCLMTYNLGDWGRNCS